MKKPTSPAKRGEPETNSRPPIVTIMGHVDHGKTSLLDAIRKSNVVKGEHGGITQHIGAYQITHNSSPITFIDTPGHAAFEKMRSRGAEAADIVVLAVAANDGVKPQTVEAIKHIKAAQKPIIAAITKVDLGDVNIDKVKKELQTAGVVVEGYGGDVPVVETAAPKGKGIDELLEVIQLVWQLDGQKLEENAPLEAVVVESFMDKNRGPVTTAIVKKGMIRVGQKISVDNKVISVRALIDENGQNLGEAGPSKPAEILGFRQVLDVGSVIYDQNYTQSSALKQPLAIEEIIAKSEEARNKFKVIIKADVAGSLEAVLANLPKNIMVVASGIGEVSASDITFAKTASAPILAFNVKVSPQIKSQADREKVIIRQYKVIYELLSDAGDIAAHFEEAKEELKIAGRAKIVASFNVDEKKIAGAMVTFGRIKIGDQIQLKTGHGKVFATKVTSLKRFKKDVETVNNGQDCGIGFSDGLDFREGDIIESLG